MPPRGQGLVKETILANNQTADGKFRPFLTNEFRPGQYVHTGGDSSSPFRNGLTVAASNHNTLIARHGHVLVNQVAKFIDPITGPGPVTWAYYVIKVPVIHSRDTVNLTVYATTTAANFRVRGTTSAGTGSWSTYDPTFGQVAVPVPTDGQYHRLTLEFQLDGAGDFMPTEVYVVQTPITTLDIGDLDSNPDNLNHVPIDSDQVGENASLTVATMRDMVRSLDEHFHQHARTVVSWCLWADHSTLDHDKGIRADYDADVTTPRLWAEYIYYPRPGVRNIRAFIAARTDGYVATGGEVTLRFSNGIAPDTATVATANTVWTEGSWAVGDWAAGPGGSITVPDGPGPFYIQIMAWAPGAATNLWLQSICLLENPESIQ